MACLHDIWRMSASLPLLPADDDYDLPTSPRMRLQELAQVWAIAHSLFTRRWSSPWCWRVWTTVMPRWLASLPPYSTVSSRSWTLRLGQSLAYVARIVSQSLWPVFSDRDSLLSVTRGAETAGAAAPAALVVRGRTGAGKCPFLQDNSQLHLHQNSVIHKRRINEVSAKEVRQRVCGNQRTAKNILLTVWVT